MNSKVDLGQSNGHSNVCKGKGVYNGTLSFGHVVPTYFAQLIPQSKLHLSVSQFVRLGAMPSAVFGKIQLRNYVRAVQIPEIWNPFESMLSKQIYTQGGTSYVPTELPKITSVSLGYFLLKNSYFSIFRRDNVTSPWKQLKKTEVTTTIIQGLNDHFKTTYGSQYSPCEQSKCLSYIGKDEEGYSTVVITPEGADYVEIFRNGVELTAESYAICFRFQQKAKNVKKIFDTLGYLQNNNETYQCLLPLCAYYKAWFDTFAPKTIGTQPNTWNNTSCAKLLYYASSSNVTNIIADGTSFNWFMTFLGDLSRTYFFTDPDFITSHISLPSYSPAVESLAVNRSNSLAMTFSNYSEGGRDVSSPNTQPSMFVDSNSLPIYQTKFAHDFLIKATRWMNANTFIGGKIDLYLKKYYGAEYTQKVESSLLGTFDVHIDINDVNASVNNEESTLGVPASKGVGGSNNNHFKYDSNTFSYVFVMSVVVPTGDYCQSADIALRNLTPEQLYMRLYDSLGYTLTDKSILCCDTMVGGTLDSSINAPFGFRPRYLEYKTNAIYRNVLSGDFRNHSTRESMSTFFTFRYINGQYLKGRYNSQSHQLEDFSYANQISELPVANSMYGSIGQFEWLGNFNRIFVEQYDYLHGNDLIREFGDLGASIVHDNFMLQQENEVSVSAPWIPIAESWDIKQADDDSSSTKIY